MYGAILVRGGGKRSIECALRNQLGRLEQAGLVRSVPISSKGIDMATTNEGENVS